MRGPTAPAHPVGQEAPSDAAPVHRATLHDRLDSLWTRYLDRLDQYTSAQASIHQHLCSGHIALAQANATGSGRGRRYGKDYYDDRTSATTTVEVRVEDGGDVPCVRVARAGLADAAEDLELVEKIDAVDLDRGHPEECARKQDGDRGLPTPAATPEPESQGAPPADGGGSSGTAREVDGRDPLRWFGILVPPVLRQAQTCFASAVLEEHAVARAANAARQMRELEVEIRRMRKCIRKSDQSRQDVDSAGG